MAEGDETLRVSLEADTSGFDKALGDLSKRASSFGTSLTRALSGAVSGSRSLESVLGQLGQRISTLALEAALKPLTSLAGGVIGQALSGIGGAASASPSGASILPFAKGGVVRAPGFFPTGGQIGLMGEAGAEAILPLKRGADGSLGVALASGGRGGGGASVVFNVSTPDAASFRRSEGQIQAMLARAALRGQRGL